MKIDLVVLVPDNAIEQVIIGLLSRTKRLGVHPVSYEILKHPHRDPGCYGASYMVLRPYVRIASKALVVMDREWDGAPSSGRAAMQSEVERQLRPAWRDRVRCIVIDPEADVWIWSDSPHVAAELGWRGRGPELRRFLEKAGLWRRGDAKPHDPKRAFHEAARKAGVHPSSALFGALARKVSLARCRDESFLDLVSTLRAWFSSAASLPGPSLFGGEA